jgi:lipopolysaccharide transport system ATP-binding protein
LEHAIEFAHVSKYFTLRHERPRSFQEMALQLLHLKPPRRGEKYWILQDVSFAVKHGEILGLIGPNGAGKSSILKLISRIIKPTSGRIGVHGRLSALLELGAGFHPDLTGRENVFLNASILGIPRQTIKERFDDIVGFAELERFIDVPVRHYSSGMYMRLGFSVAVYTDPEILLVDEVLAVGDQAFQGRCLDKIQELVRAGVSILFVSHDMKTVRSLCDRVIWLDAGHIRAEGNPEDVVNAYVGGLTEAELAEVTACRGRLSDGRRFGSREVQITEISLLDDQGNERYVFESGESLTIRIAYRCQKPVKRPVFGLAIFRTDGWHINGPNTRFSDYPIDEIRGSGYVDYRIDVLPLLGGAYQLAVSIYDYELQRPYDHYEQCLTFVVKNQRVKEEFGCVYFPASWEHQPSTEEV